MMVVIGAVADLVFIIIVTVERRIRRTARAYHQASRKNYRVKERGDSKKIHRLNEENVEFCACIAIINVDII